MMHFLLDVRICHFIYFCVQYTTKVIMKIKVLYFVVVYIFAFIFFQVYIKVQSILAFYKTKVYM